ncbi:cysteine hydrolase family protein [Kaistia defluvii]|uniref:Nicotinamidase-related amidase n=1 Tax=Kaistia defluvii TaxID=410841 RepID=A0ABV2QU55_9HYPH
MSQRAIVVVDLQNDYFPDGKWSLEGIEAAAAQAAKVIDAARQGGDAVIHIQHLATSPEAPFFVPGTEGAEIHAAVRPQGDETVVTKHFPNAFRETVLKQVLNERGIDEVVLVGAMSHMCIAATGRAAADFGYKTVVIHDACATRALEFNGTTVPAAQVHAANMAALAFGYAKVIGAAEWIAGEG